MEPIASTPAAIVQLELAAGELAALRSAVDGAQPGQETGRLLERVELLRGVQERLAHVARYITEAQKARPRGRWAPPDPAPGVPSEFMQNIELAKRRAARPTTTD